MLWIGITGPMGSGKSTVSHLLRQRGFEVLDADQVATKVLSPDSPGEEQVLKAFGQHLQDRNGHLDRRALGRLVFNDRAKLALLEKIIHPRVRDEVSRQRARLAAQGHTVAFYDVPLLFEKNMRGQFDYVIVVMASSPLRAERVRTRSQLTDDEIVERNARHLSPEFKEAAASVVVRNEGSMADLNLSLDHALQALKIPLSPTSTKT